MILQQEGGRETFFARSFLRDVALFWNSKRELNAGSPIVSHYEKKLKGIRWTTRSSWLAWKRWYRCGVVVRRFLPLWISLSQSGLVAFLYDLVRAWSGAG